MLRNVDPFNLIFEAPYGMDLTSVLADIVDETSGVIEHDENFFEQVNEDGELNENESSINSKKVLLVHGHDKELKETAAHFIEKLGLSPIILHEQVNNGTDRIHEKVDGAKDDCSKEDLRYLKY